MAQNFKMKGQIVKINDTQQITDNLRKREFILYVENKENKKWDKHINFELAGKNCEKIDEFTINDHVEVSFNIDGKKVVKEGRDRYYVSLRVFNIEFDNE